MDLKTKRLIWYLIYYANWAIILGFWWHGSGNTFMSGGSLTLLALGRLAGLAAAHFILVQVFLMGRTPWLERVFGLDRLSRMHHKNGRWAIIILLFHPTLLTLSYSKLADISLWSQFTSFLFDYEDVMSAFIAFILFIIVVLTSITISRSRLKYENW